MTIQEAFEIIEKMVPCAICEYRTSSCDRKSNHVWTDGMCHSFDEALEVISAVIPDEELIKKEPIWL